MKGFAFYRHIAVHAGMQLYTLQGYKGMTPNME